MSAMFGCASGNGLAQDEAAIGCIFKMFGIVYFLNVPWCVLGVFLAHLAK